MAVERKGISIKAAECKVSQSARTVEMYSSVTEVRDLMGDVIHRGAFEATLDEKRDPDGSVKTWRIPLLWQHDTGQPIGRPVELHEDERGLYSKDFVPDTGPGCPGTRALILAEAKVIWGASIGYTVLEQDEDDEAVRHIHKLELFERSLVTFPANPEAGVTGVQKRLQLLSPGLQLKVGRVLSSANFSRLEKAVELLQEVLETAVVPSGKAMRGPAETKGATPFADLPLAPEDQRWNPRGQPDSELIGAILGPDGDNWARAKEAHLWWDGTGGTQDAYKLKVARMFDPDDPDNVSPENGTLHVVLSQLASRVAILNGARGGVDISDADRKACYAHAVRYYQKADREAPPLKQQAEPLSTSQQDLAELRESVERWLSLFGAR